MSSPAVAWRVRRAEALLRNELPTSGADLWAVRLNVWEDEPNILRNILSEDERQRADKFVFSHHRRQFIISHAFLRQVLAGYVAAKPHELSFRRGSHGKPAVVAPTYATHLQFSLSHCEELALVGVASQPIGVDVEVMRQSMDCEDVAGHYLHPLESRTLARLSSHERRDAFYRCWTRKEAIVKAIGCGLSIPLDSFRVTLTADVPAELVQHDHRFPLHSVWRLEHLEPSRGVIGAFATPFPLTLASRSLIVGTIIPTPSAYCSISQRWHEKADEEELRRASLPSTDAGSETYPRG